jgi:hypothetical protein
VKVCAVEFPVDSGILVLALLSRRMGRSRRWSSSRSLLEPRSSCRVRQQIGPERVEVRRGGGPSEICTLLPRRGPVPAAMVGGRSGGGARSAGTLSSSASAMRARRLSRMPCSRLRWAGSILRRGHLMHDGWMWDLTVPGNDDHDFYVAAGETPVLVHNQCPWTISSHLRAAGTSGQVRLATQTFYPNP